MGFFCFSTFEPYLLNGAKRSDTSFILYMRNFSKSPKLFVVVFVLQKGMVLCHALHTVPYYYQL